MAKQTIAGNKGDHYSSIWFPLKYRVRTQFSDLALTDIPIHSYSRVSSRRTGTAIYFEEICQPVQAYQILVLLYIFRISKILFQESNFSMKIEVILLNDVILGSNYFNWYPNSITFSTVTIIEIGKFVSWYAYYMWYHYQILQSTGWTHVKLFVI